MALYIKDAELPDSCSRCPFEHFGDCYAGRSKYIMDVDDDYEQYITERHSDCPLIEAPESDALLNKVVQTIGERAKIAFICDGSKCGTECMDCHHTSDIKHAKNFKCIDGKYYEERSED